MVVGRKKKKIHKRNPLLKIFIALGFIFVAIIMFFSTIVKKKQVD